MLISYLSILATHNFMRRNLRDNKFQSGQAMDLIMKKNCSMCEILEEKNKKSTFTCFL